MGRKNFRECFQVGDYECEKKILIYMSLTYYIMIIIIVYEKIYKCVKYRRELFEYCTLYKGDW